MATTSEKAQLSLLKADGKTVIESIPLQFNPEKYQKSWAVTWGAQDASGNLQWTRTTPGDLTLTLHFYTYEEGKDVRNKTKVLLETLEPSAGRKPMGCLFQWGKMVYKGVVKSIQEEYTLFLTDGTPVRSQVTLTLQSWPGELQNFL